MTDLELRIALKTAIDAACDEYDCLPEVLEGNDLTEITVDEIRAMLRILEDRT